MQLRDFYVGRFLLPMPEVCTEEGELLRIWRKGKEDSRSGGAVYTQLPSGPAATRLALVFGRLTARCCTRKPA